MLADKGLLLMIYTQVQRRDTYLMVNLKSYQGDNPMDNYCRSPRPCTPPKRHVEEVFNFDRDHDDLMRFPWYETGPCFVLRFWPVCNIGGDFGHLIKLLCP